VFEDFETVEECENWINYLLEEIFYCKERIKELKSK
tara:strand:+ start:30 stop:137 length:108 start_codon:yes stop_codon:yes gene_type:complete